LKIEEAIKGREKGHAGMREELKGLLWRSIEQCESAVREW
jgi:hypothetical protein